MTRYFQPFDQPASPNASYTNGNQAIGLQGSIPDARAIEQPQRELVNFITDSGLTPSESDLHQLGESVQAARVAFGIDVGTSGAIQIQLVPAPPFIEQGLVVRILIANNIPGPTTLNPNGFGNFNTKFSGLPLTANILEMGDIGEFIYDGTNFQLIGGARGVKFVLFLPTTFYVDPVHGNDLNDGLTSGSAWKTLNHAYSFLQQHYDFNGQTVTIICLFPNNPTNYASFQAIGGITGMFSEAQLLIVGDVTNKHDTITVTGTSQICASASSGAMFTISGFTFTATGTQCVGLQAQNGGRITSLNNIFANATQYALSAAGSGANVTTGNTNTFDGDFTGLMNAEEAASMLIEGSIITSANASQGTIVAINVGIVSIPGGTTFGGAGVNGPRFVVSSNAVIDTGGQQTTVNTAYIPGTSSGLPALGGQFF